MLNEYKQLVFNYLHKNYKLENNLHCITIEGKKEWGVNILDSIIKIFDLDRKLAEEFFKEWLIINKLKLPYSRTFDEYWLDFIRPKTLKATWSTELVNDIYSYGFENVEQEMIQMLIGIVSEEIGSSILDDIRLDVKSCDEFLGIMKCIGYKTAAITYDEQTFTPRKKFIGMDYDDIENERKNNILWQNWIRTRKQNQEA